MYLSLNTRSEIVLKHFVIACQYLRSRSSLTDSFVIITVSGISYDELLRREMLIGRDALRNSQVCDSPVIEF